MRLPSPIYTFTIPSIHDDVTLSCRIYHPPALCKPPQSDTAPWQKKGIIIAHPYAVLGGCYDDRVVGFVAEEFLDQDYIVGTFNFRGASPSKGKTSWTGKPEFYDYFSFAGLFMHYLQFLSHPGTPPATPDRPPVSEDGCPRDNVLRSQDPAPVKLVLGGYSYGSLILRHLPPVEDILRSYAAAEDGTSMSEIVLRARKLSNETNKEWTQLVQEHTRKAKNGRLVVGGEETSPEARRKSSEMGRSTDIAHSHRHKLSGSIRSISSRLKKSTLEDTDIKSDTPLRSLSTPSISYLLVSPLQAPIATTLAPGLGGLWGKARSRANTIVEHPTLAVFGHNDMFTSTKKSQAWGEKLAKEPGSKFRYVEITSAGHFWHEPGVEAQLRYTLQDWIRRLDGARGS